MILFEGVDKTGKTTLMYRFNKETQYRHMVLQRYFLTHIAYADVYGRELDMEQLMSEVPPNLLIILCDANADVIEYRIAKAGDEPIDVVRDKTAFLRALSVFQNYVHGSKCNFRLTYVNTSLLTEREAMEHIHTEVAAWESSRKS